MSTSLPGVAFVTGAGAGIGRACATALAADGFLVAVNDLDEAACASTVDLIRSGGCQAEAFPFDVSDEAAWHSAAREIRSVLGAVTALVHNAAVKASSDPGDGALLDMQLSSWARLVRAGALVWGPHFLAGPTPARLAYHARRSPADGTD